MQMWTSVQTNLAIPMPLAPIPSEVLSALVILAFLVMASTAVVSEVVVKSINLTCFIATDIDECSYSSNGGCSQNCTNTMGSFFCQCEVGYMLSNQTECLGKRIKVRISRFKYFSYSALRK